MKLLLSSALFCLVSFSLFSQEIVPEASRASKTNANGDPVTNIMDPDGMKQGDWYYANIYDSTTIIKRYTNNKCIETLYPSKYGEWTSSDKWEQNQEIIQSIKVKVYSFLKSKEITLQNDQQFALIFDVNGELKHFSPLGNWNIAQATDIEVMLHQEFMPSSQLGIKENTFILF